MNHFRRWGLVWAVSAIAAVLVASTAWIHVGLASHTDEFAQIHGEYVLSWITEPTTDVQQVLESLRPVGVHAVTRFDAGGRRLASAGPALDPDARAGVVAQSSRRGPYRIEHPDADGVLVLEYEPLLARDMQRRTSLALVTSLVASIALIGFAALWMRFRLRLEAAELLAERSRHLAHLGTLSSVVAHELRNPLTVLLGHVQLLREDFPENTRVRHVESGAERLEQLLGSLLTFARTGEVNLEPVLPVELLQEAIAQAQVEPVRLEGTAPSWSLDRVRMRQVVVNLLQNARLADPEGPITVRLSATDGQLVIEVEDHGDGIPEAERERVFEPFHTTRTQGTGLGLAIARDIVAKHGGTMSIHDAHPKGALLRIAIST